MRVLALALTVFVVAISTTATTIAAQTKDHATEPQGILGSLVSLLTGLAWPMLVLGVIIAYRGPLGRILILLGDRVAKGDKFTALGVSVEASTAAPMPAAITSSEQNPATTRSIVQTLSLSAGDSVLVALGEADYGEDELALVGVGDALGLALVLAALLQGNALAVTASVIRKTTALRELVEKYNAAVIIGGPKANQLSQAVMASTALTYEFRGAAIYDLNDRRLHQAKFSSDRMDGTDWGIIALVNNPLVPDRRIALLAGISGYGTNAAAAVFARLGDFPELTASAETEALIRVKIVGGVVEAPEVVAMRALTSKPVT